MHYWEYKLSGYHIAGNVEQDGSFEFFEHWYQLCGKMDLFKMNRPRHCIWIISVSYL